MGKDLYLIILAITGWASGYFYPECESNTPLKFLNTYVFLPKWLNGFLRKRCSNQISDGVVSTRALSAQLSAFLIILLFIGFKLNFTFLDNFLFRVYGWMLCVFLGMIFSVIIRRFRPYIPE